MKALESDSIAAADAAGREHTAPHINPFIALASAVLGPILGLFRSRQSNPVAVRALKLESYSSSPVRPPSRSEGEAKENRTRSEGEARGRVGPPPRAPFRRRRATLNHGGHSHG